MGANRKEGARPSARRFYKCPVENVNSVEIAMMARCGAGDVL